MLYCASYLHAHTCFQDVHFPHFYFSPRLILPSGISPLPTSVLCFYSSLEQTLFLIYVFPVPTIMNMLFILVYTVMLIQ
ncbi:hypothetical protein Hamer_G029075 [Homarus americanus]|uniref:Uncharacterized protein n=1 Tax=Homarus americanus TaxID=6706 RepID=A0A8J5JHP8_HOMAM|nr:hypothetical protein Hamer_G029075 [Homarus americanus]